MDAMLPQSFLITGIHPESSDVFSLSLQPPSASQFVFSPGQFNMLYAFGIGEAAISISSDPNASEQITHTIRVVGSVTKYLQKLQCQQFIGVRGPFGTGWPMTASQGKSLLLIAGGIGLAPLRSVVYALLAERQKYQDITLLIGARKPHDLIYQQEFSSWRQHLNLILTVDQPEKSWQGHVGVVTQLIPALIKDPDNTLVMMCGPELMMRFSYFALREERIPEENIYLSMERNMQCGIGHCGHCQWGPYFICKEGPVLNFKTISSFFFKNEL